ncbi:universal stress protein [Streptomyces sp. NPDC050095]|uniref:universal stress protein n=1 Tax=unclassified Streptomyces TaxID=2593676 RepID=UPI003441AD30
MLRPVVVGVDASPESLAAVEWAATEALRRDRPLRLVHACNWSPHPPSDVPTGVTAAGAAQTARARTVLDVAMARVDTDRPAIRASADLLEGPASVALLRVGGQGELLVLGSRGLGAVSGVVVGSVAQTVAAAAPVPVVLVRAHAGEAGPGSGLDRDGEEPKDAPIADVVLGLDLADPCDEVIEFAFTAAELRGARLHVVSAWRSPAFYLPGPGELALARGPQREEEWRGFQEAVLQSWRGKFPDVPVLGTLAAGRAATPLLSATEQACLVVVGRRTPEGRAGQHNGPVTHAVVHHARCPVAIVPHP